MTAFRDDLQLLTSYRYRQRPPLGCSIDILCGRSDPTVTPGATQDWTKETSRGARLVEFAGGHMFIRDAGDAVQFLSRELKALKLSS